MTILPSAIRVDAATICQLRCPTCPTTEGLIGKTLGSGFLKFSDFKDLVDLNPWIKDVELSNWGEIFLNPDLMSIIKYASEKGITVRADNGTNFNNVKDEVLEALVKYKFDSFTCSIDGASPAVYSMYRVRGDFDQVLENIRKLNALKQKYRTSRPRLIWQFIAFGHNEHEIEAAKLLAKSLGMEFRLKLAWDSTIAEQVSPAPVSELARKESSVGAATRHEYREKYGRNYMQEHNCSQLWRQPKVNFDGRVFGCCFNYWKDFGNAFQDGLLNVINGEKMNYARNMLLGQADERPDIPCTSCVHYKQMKSTNRWLDERQVFVVDLDPSRPSAKFKWMMKAAGRKLLQSLRAR